MMRHVAVLVSVLILVLGLGAVCYAMPTEFGPGDAWARDAGRSLTLGVQALGVAAVLAAALGAGGILRRRARQ